MKKARRGCIFRIFLVLIGLCLMIQLPREPARWQLAAALEDYLDNDLALATSHLDRAIEWRPQNEELLGIRAQWRLRMGDADQALMDIERAVELWNPSGKSNPPKGKVDHPQLTRAKILLALSRGQEAVDIYDIMIPESENYTKEVERFVFLRWLIGSYVSRREKHSWHQRLLNGRAYTRAQAKLDIPKAIEDIDAAFAVPVFGSDLQINEFQYGLVDTRGYLHLLAKNLERARNDMEAAVELGRLLGRQLDIVRIRPSSPIDRRDLEDSIRQHREGMAAVYHHRGLVYQALEKTQKAESDLRKAEELGFDPGTGVW